MDYAKIAVAAAFTIMTAAIVYRGAWLIGLGHGRWAGIQGSALLLLGACVWGWLIWSFSP